MQTVSRSTFTTITTEGAILPADLLRRIVDGRDLDGLKPTDYHLAPNERLNEAINRSWNRLLGVWESFDERRQELPEYDRGTTLTRESWLLILLDELGFGRPTFVSSLSVNGASDEADGDGEGARYPISHQWQHVPLHLITFRQSLDRVDEDRGERFRRSPHSLVQEFLNRSEQHLWAVVSNGLRLRILRDNVSFTRAAYLEFDLEAMMDGEIYADFTLLWLAAHQSRFEGDPQTCWLEKWSQEAAEQGTRALDSLRDGVQNAISELGRGFLAYPANKELRAKLQRGELDKQEYYRQLLRMVYRLIFLFVAEERNLLLVQGADAATRERYYDYYSVTHLRELAARRRSGPHPDIYRTLRLVMELLREGYQPLGLPGLGSFLFSARSTPDLDDLDMANEALLKAIRALTFTVQDGVLRPVDYKNLGSEELGSVYESLLELHPELNVGAATFKLRTAAGSERKTTGSYYTPTSLINSLLDTALEPVVADRLRGKRGKEAEEALLDIKVVDPAAGSGHFLIAAANRLARHLARIRTGDEEPSPEANRLALRDVVRRCIHGVDVNEMAVELCKVSLWLETLDPGKPLNFLDANIQHGNSLIGATPELLDEGIPDDAFKPVTGDDKEYAREFKKLNREQRKGQMALFKGGQPWQRLGDLATALQEMAALEGDTLEGVQAQEEAYAELVSSQGYEYGKLWADAWCAAFFWHLLPEDEGGFAYPITEEEFRRIEHSPFSIPAWMREEIERLAESHHFFHWHLAFPHIFDLSNGAELAGKESEWLGGFDVVLSNPPWEKINLKDEEFFAYSYPKIAQASTKAKRKKLIGELKQTDPVEYERYQDAQTFHDQLSVFFRYSRAFPFTGVSRINLYSVFAELSVRIVSMQGRLGLVIASGVATDDNNKDLFYHLMRNNQLVAVWDFENREALFPEVHRMYKFCLFCVAGSDQKVKEADFAFFLTNPIQLSDDFRHFSLSAADLAAINPNTRTAPTFRNKYEAELTKSIYRRVKAWCLQEADEGWPGNPKTPFNMSNDSGLFFALNDLADVQADFDNFNCASSGESRYLPLYESKLIHQFNHRYATFDDKGESTSEMTALELQEPTNTIQPQYWLEESILSERYPGEWFLAYRMITNAANERTSIMTVVPKRPCSNSLSIIESISAHSAAIMCSNMNSFVHDFVARQKVPGTNFNHWIWKQLPVTHPWQVRTLGGVFGKPGTLLWLLDRFIELTYTSYDIQSFARDLGYYGPPLWWNEERRFLLRCELDAAYFHIYGIEREDVDYIMDTFPIVRRKDEDEYGDYRTKRVILEIYDEMGEAIETGDPYQTRLDPPPAHPDAAHAWDEEYLGSELPREEWWQEVEPSAPMDGEKPKATYEPSPTRKPVKEPAPDFELKPPTQKQPQPKTRTAQGAQQGGAQPPLITEFTLLEGNRSQRLKQVMALGDKVKANRQDAESIAQLAAALGDEDESIRWLAGSALGLLGGATVVRTLGAYLAQVEDERGRDGAVKALRRIAENAREDEGVRQMAKELQGE